MWIKSLKRISGLLTFTRVMLNTLPFNSSVDKGSLWAILNATVVYTHSIVLDDPRVDQFLVKFI